MKCNKCFTLSSELEAMRRELLKLKAIIGRNTKTSPNNTRCSTGLRRSQRIPTASAATGHQKERKMTTRENSVSPSTSRVTKPIKLSRKGGDGWQVQPVSKSPKNKTEVNQPVLKLENRFEQLSNIDCNISAIDPLKVVMVGDSMVRGQGEIFSMRSKKKAFVKCLPGAGIDDVKNALTPVESVLQTTVVSVGTNDLSHCKNDEIKIKYLELLKKLRDRPSPSIVMGILPRIKESEEWNRRAKEVNGWLHKECLKRNFIFVNLFDYFRLKPYLYLRDGVHLNTTGKKYISSVIDEITDESSLFHPFL